MRLPLSPHRSAWAVLAGAGLLALLTTPAKAQITLPFSHQQDCPPAAAPRDYRLPPVTGEPGAPPTVAPAAPALGEERFGALASETVALAESNVGYIDSALPATQLRLRLDAGFNNHRPDRAEFFYPKCGCFGFTPGPGSLETSVDFQEVAAYLEVAANDRMSGFLEVPFRFLNPDANHNTAGPGDINGGFKFVLMKDCNTVVTFQLRGYLATGDGDRGLGTDHTSVEPGLLVLQELNDKLNLEAELRYWQPFYRTDFAGSILRYGVGLSYQAYQGCGLRITPVAEWVAWTVLDGHALAATPFGTSYIEDAEGDTIVNFKAGVRWGLSDRADLYTGYGRALTGDRWYEDIYRLELRLGF